MTVQIPDFHTISEVTAKIRPHVRLTPTVEVSAADFGLIGAPITLKLEQLQHAGSFKTRGAFANLLLREANAAGVVAASGGNHGAAVAYAAMRLGIPATIFVPTISNPAKVQRIRDYGAELRQIGERYADALEASEIWRARTGALAVHAFDDFLTVAGQGSVGLELEMQAPKLDTVLVGVGGGGLVGGIAAYFDGRVRVIGVEPVGAPTLTYALAAGQPVDAPANGYAADSLAPKRIGDIPFAIARRFVERVVLVEDDAIRKAQAELWRRLRIVAEPGGAAAFAALHSRQYEPAAGERVGVVVSGANTDAVRFG